MHLCLVAPSDDFLESAYFAIFVSRFSCLVEHLMGKKAAAAAYKRVFKFDVSCLFEALIFSHVFEHFSETKAPAAKCK